MEDTTSTPVETEAPEAPSRPEYVPEKFWNAETGEVNVEGLATSYTSLEQKQSQPEPEAPTEPVEAAPALDLQPLADHFAAEGSLSEEHYAQLEANGISKMYADQYIHGLAASQQMFTQEIHNEVGGPENFTAMYQWAQSQLSPEEFGAFEQSLTEVNITDATAINSLKLGVKGMYARWRENTSQPPAKTVEGATGSTTPADIYASKMEMMRDMNSYMYKRDPAEQERVTAKLERTMKANPNF